VHGQLNLIDLAPNDLLPRLSSWGEASNQQLGQESLGLGLRVNDSETPLGYWQN
jgi:hypothetical protein